MKKITILAALLFAIAGCQDDDGNVINTEPVAIEFADVQKGEISGDPLPAANYVINTPAQWTEFKDHINSIYNEDMEIDVFEGITVDFEEYTVLAVLDQAWPNGGYSAEITSVIEESGAITASVDYSSPGGGNVTTILCQPYHVIKIPKTTLPVAFEAE
jgi:hypothetical protein